MSKDNNGKLSVQKAGLKEITREGFEYELTLSFNIENKNHLAVASKDRTGLFDGKPEFVITEKTGEALLNWANSGEKVKSVDEVVKDLESVKSMKHFENIKNKYMDLYKNNEAFVKAGIEAKERLSK